MSKIKTIEEWDGRTRKDIRAWKQLIEPLERAVTRTGASSYRHRGNGVFILRFDCGGKHWEEGVTLRDLADDRFESWCDDLSRRVRIYFDGYDRYAPQS